MMQLETMNRGQNRLEGMVDRINQDGIGHALLDALTGSCNHTLMSRQNDWVKRFLIQAIYQSEPDDIQSRNAPPFASHRREHQLHKIFLDKLHYQSMLDRDNRIAEAYQSTFEWIFEYEEHTERPWSNFRRWLESNEPLYWITGKAGSGKSTLMKFITQPLAEDADPALSAGIDELPASRCSEFLKTWSAGQDLVLVSFYFWNAGNAIQMSQEGLLRSLLFQILSQMPAMISEISPTKWEALSLFNQDPESFTESEMRDMLQSVVQKGCQDRKFCFFIDGLDEFEGDGKYLIRLFQGLTSNQGVKVCVSSRPWVEFQDAFEHRPSLMLQDLTYPDIKRYVTNELGTHLDFAVLQRREPEYASQLINELMEKASGVFLWVTVVVKSLLVGMKSGDRVADLQRRLALLPPDLEDLYDRILRTLNPFYLEHAAQLFNVVQACPEPPLLTLLSFADNEDPESACNRASEPLLEEQLDIQADAMRRRLDTRCRGFLEVTQCDPEPACSRGRTVQYLHRSVKDYIQSDKAQVTLCAPKFDPHLSLCTGALAYLKSLSDRDGQLFWELSQLCLFGAARLKDNDDTLFLILDELDKFGSQYAKRIVNDLQAVEAFTENAQGVSHLAALEAGHWTHFCPGDRKGLSTSGPHFLSYALFWGLSRYAIARSGPGCLVEESENLRPLLLDVIDALLGQTYPCRSSLAYKPVSDNAEVLLALLKNGADPNHVVSGEESSRKSRRLLELVLDFVDYASFPYYVVPHHLFSAKFRTSTNTVWLHTLSHIINAFSRNKIASPLDLVAELMIAHGARVKPSQIRSALPDIDWTKRHALMHHLWIIQKNCRSNFGSLMWTFVGALKLLAIICITLLPFRTLLTTYYI